MSYLFKDIINPALLKDRNPAQLNDEDQKRRAKARHLKEQSKEITGLLYSQHQRILNKADDYDRARTQVQSMGRRDKPPTGDWAGNYANWYQVSSNAGLITQMVYGELHKAYQLGLDICSSQVIGAMFQLATMVWSELGDYSSPSQDEGRR